MSAELIALANTDISDAYRCRSLNIIPNPHGLLRSLRLVVDALEQAEAEVVRLRETFETLRDQMTDLESNDPVTEFDYGQNNIAGHVLDVLAQATVTETTKEQG